MLKALREKEKKTQSEIAAAVGISQRMYSSIENGERRPSPEVADKIAKLFGLSVEQMWELFYAKKNA